MSEETKLTPKKDDLAETTEAGNIELVEEETERVAGGWTWVKGGVNQA